jgi:hypothetical protein
LIYLIIRIYLKKKERFLIKELVLDIIEKLVCENTKENNMYVPEIKKYFMNSLGEIKN